LVERGVFPSAMFPGIIYKELALGDAGRTEGVRLDDVCPSLQKTTMDVADHAWLSQREKVTVVQQILLRVLEVFATDVRFGHTVRTNRRAHGTINDGDTVDTARKLMRDNLLTDVFIVDAQGVIIGWLTDTHVLRYMDAPK